MRRNSRPSATDSRPAAPPAPRTIVLGIDPGTLVTGYGIVARRGSVLTLLGCGTIRNAGTHSMPVRLRRIYEELTALVTRFTPDECAIESAFYGRNAQSALKLGHARGVSILAAVGHDIPVAEYSPREVKKSVVGKGTASKEQVRFMVRSLLRIDDAHLVLDASDALAIALCHLHHSSDRRSSFRDWKSFVEAHPERVKR